MPINILENKIQFKCAYINAELRDEVGLRFVVPVTILVRKIFVTVSRFCATYISVLFVCFSFDIAINCLPF